MKIVVGENSGWLHMLVWLGLFGLVASFHGIIIGYSRQIFALARAGYLPALLRRGAPALRHAAPRASSPAAWSASPRSSATSWINFGGQTLTANIVTMSVFGAIVMYDPQHGEPVQAAPQRAATWSAPFARPVLPGVPGHSRWLAALVCLGAMVYFNPARRCSSSA